jgi:hypothetical protein
MGKKCLTTDSKALIIYSKKEGNSMKVRIRRKAKSIWSEFDTVLAREAVNFGIDYLGLWACDTPLRVVLRGYYDCGTYGDSLDLDTEIIIRLSPEDHWIKTIFHELAHVRQYVDDELELEEKTAVWKGEIYTRTIGGYMDEPWEIEARELEETIYRDFRTKILTSLP